MPFLAYDKDALARFDLKFDEFEQHRNAETEAFILKTVQWHEHIPVAQSRKQPDARTGRAMLTRSRNLLPL